MPLNLVPFLEQAPLSDVTRYSGTINVEIDDPLAPTTIRFLAGSVVAEDNGSWRPERGGGIVDDAGMPQPANYGLAYEAGGLFSVLVALRDFQFSLASGPLAINGHTFPSSQAISVLSGSIEANVISSLPIPSGPLSESQVGKVSANAIMQQGSFRVLDGIATLSLPIDITFVGGLAGETPDPTRQAQFIGELIATARIALPGDFNADNAVDAADYVVWRDSLGQTGANLPADGDGSTTIDLADYNIWRANFGRTPSSGSIANGTVPEPATVGLLIIWAAGSCLRRRLRRQQL
jgi:hypothetical protein